MSAQANALQSALYWKSKADEALENRNEAVVTAYTEGVPVLQIAQRLAMSRRGIYAILNREGIRFSIKTS